MVNAYPHFRDIVHKQFQFAAMAMESGLAEGNKVALHASQGILKDIMQGKTIELPIHKQNGRNLIPFVQLGLGMTQDCYDLLKTIAVWPPEFWEDPEAYKEDMLEDIFECEGPEGPVSFMSISKLMIFEIF